MITKLLFLQFLLAFSRTTVMNNNTSSDDQRGLIPSVQNFANQFKSITRDKFKVSVVKVATSGPHLIVSRIKYNNMTSNQLYTDSEEQSSLPRHFLRDKILQKICLGKCLLNKLLNLN